MRTLVKYLGVGAIVFLMTVAVSSPAQAQTNIGGSFGYGPFHTSTGDFGTNYPLGFYGDVNGTFSAMKELNWVGQVAYGRHSESDISVNVVTFSGGGRYTWHQNTTALPFAQVLVGVAHVSGGGGGFSASENDGLIDFDLGVDIPIRMKTWAIRGSVGYARVFTSGTGTNVVGLHIGITKPLK